MAGHRVSKTVRTKLKAGQSVRVYRGWRPDELPERPASACRRIDPQNGKVVGVLIVVPTKQLRLTARPPWRLCREVQV